MAQNNVELGNRAFQEARYADAAACYERALEENKAAPTYINLGHARTRLSQWHKAIAAYEAAIALDEEACGAEVFRTLGQAWYMIQRYEEALRFFAKANRLGGQPEDPLWIARCLIESDQWSRAESGVFEYLRIRPDDAQALELLAHIFMRSGKPPEAARIHEKLARREPGRIRHYLGLAEAQVASGDHGAAIDTLECARLAAEDSDEAANRLLADLYVREEMHREAAEAYHRLLAAANDPTAEDFFRLGYAHMQGEEYLSATEAFAKARQLDPAHAKAALYLGHIAARRSEVEKARSAYLAAAQAAPSSPEPRVALAELYMKNGRFERAAEEFAKAIDLGERSIAVHHNRVYALTQAGDFDGAVAALKRARRDHPLDQRLNTPLDHLAEEAAKRAD